MSENEIWIIGTEPPCPRCDYLTRMAQDIVNLLELPIPVRHISYTSTEAKQFAAPLGLEPGTAKDVSRKAEIDMDWERVNSLIDSPNQMSSKDTCCSTASSKWSPELDEALRPCENQASNVGIMMTPVLVIAGRRIHQGSVPARADVLKWITQAFHGHIRPEDDRDIVEVLGPGCKNCATLYRNVLEALTTANLHERVVVKKRTDINYFKKMGVSITPGLVINGHVVSKGRLLSQDQIVDHLKANLY